MNAEMIVARALDRHLITTGSYVSGGGVTCECGRHVAARPVDRNDHLAEVAVQALRDTKGLAEDPKWEAAYLTTKAMQAKLLERLRELCAALEVNIGPTTSLNDRNELTVRGWWQILDDMIARARELNRGDA
jgi:hypothetical protein